MTTLFDEAKPVLQSVYRELVAALPEGWTSGVLTVRRMDHAELGEGAVGYRHQLVSDEGRREVATLDAPLFDATAQLAEVFRRFDKPWEAITVRAAWNEAGSNWECVADFEYLPEVVARTVASSPKDPA
jgi:hypothetical protein